MVSADGHPAEGTYVLGGKCGGATHRRQSKTMRRSYAGVAWELMIAGAPIVPAVAGGLAIASLMSLAGLLFFISRSGAPGNGRKATAARRCECCRS